LPEDKEKFLKGEIASIRTTQYDLVCNGLEVGGGSIRSTDPKILAKVFETIGHDIKDIKKQFGHMLEAFEYGVPPHGGIAPGIDRLMMVLTGETAMKEVVAFPTTSKGITSIMDAPSSLAATQLKELHLCLSAS
jgi:aspartyl-tRNA synthetase